jgi:integrase
MRKRLSDRTLRTLKPQAKRFELWDTDVGGLGVRVATSGKVYFILAVRPPGKRHPERRSIGEYPHECSLAEARDTAIAWKRQLRKGIDPAVERERQDAAERRKREDLFAAVCDRFFAHIAPLRRAHEVERDIRRELIPRWGNRPISDISKRDVLAVIDETISRGARWQAHHNFSHARRLFNFAVDRGLVEVSPCSAIRARRVIGPKTARSRVLDDAELQALWRAAEQTGYPFGSLVKLLLLTGQRRTEAAAASWREFDLDKGIWTLAPERMKANSAHIVPLSSEALDLLHSLPNFESSPYLFTFDGKKPINGFSKSKRRFDAVMRRHLDGKLEPFVLHDVRRSVRTRLAALGVSDTVSELVIGHTKPGLHKIYNQHAYLDEKQQALNLWAAKLRDIVSGAVS